SRHYRPRVVFVDADNRIVHEGSDLDAACRGELDAVGGAECCSP
ncbi:MAG: aspartate 1-decarboxylase, partial [Actinomycetota bacterium]|nr:aspartate 1-decarboxylase [Actinomycetota bacterium]